MVTTHWDRKTTLTFPHLHCLQTNFHWPSKTKPLTIKPTIEPRKSTPLKELFETKLPLPRRNLVPKPYGLPKVKFPDFQEEFIISLNWDTIPWLSVILKKYIYLPDFSLTVATLNVVFRAVMVLVHDLSTRPNSGKLDKLYSAPKRRYKVNC